MNFRSADEKIRKMLIEMEIQFWGYLRPIYLQPLAKLFEKPLARPFAQLFAKPFAQPFAQPFAKPPFAKEPFAKPFRF